MCNIKYFNNPVLTVTVYERTNIYSPGKNFQVDHIAYSLLL